MGGPFFRQNSKTADVFLTGFLLGRCGACLHAQVRSSYAADLQHRTELENLLRGAVEEVVQEVMHEQGRICDTNSVGSFSCRVCISCLGCDMFVFVPIGLKSFRSTQLEPQSVVSPQQYSLTT